MDPILEWIWQFILRHQTSFLVLAWLAFNIYRKMNPPPFPDCGGNAQSVHSKAEFDSVLAKAKSDGAVVVADFYATWCPPCRAAAPKFARWSEEFASTVFIKVDVDKARDVATSQAIQAMPTFKFYKDNACIETIQGFNEQKIAAALGKLGKKEK